MTSTFRRRKLSSVQMLPERRMSAAPLRELLGARCLAARGPGSACEGEHPG
jgi:hypothetical protein